LKPTLYFFAISPSLHKKLHSPRRFYYSARECHCEAQCIRGFECRQEVRWRNEQR
jgi:hypothetical protein